MEILSSQAQLYFEKSCQDIILFYKLNIKCLSVCLSIFELICMEQ